MQGSTLAVSGQRCFQVLVARPCHHLGLAGFRGDQTLLQCLYLQWEHNYGIKNLLESVPQMMMLFNFKVTPGERIARGGRLNN